MERVLYTPYRRPPSDAEWNDGSSMTEQAGYIPAKEQIEELMAAGGRLKAYRGALYDVEREEDLDPEFEDITRNPNFDMADASMQAAALAGRVERKRRMEEKRLKEEAAAKAEAEKTAPQPGAEVEPTK